MRIKLSKENYVAGTIRAIEHPSRKGEASSI